MSSNSDMFDRWRAGTAIAYSPTSETDTLTAPDRAVCIDYSFIFEPSEAKIIFPMHRLIGNYAEYGRLFLAKN